MSVHTMASSNHDEEERSQTQEFTGEGRFTFGFKWSFVRTSMLKERSLGSLFNDIVEEHEDKNTSKEAINREIHILEEVAKTLSTVIHPADAPSNEIFFFGLATTLAKHYVDVPPEKYLSAALALYRTLVPVGNNYPITDLIEGIEDMNPPVHTDIEKRIKNNFMAELPEGANNEADLEAIIKKEALKERLWAVVLYLVATYSKDDLKFPHRLYNEELKLKSEEFNKLVLAFFGIVGYTVNFSPEDLYRAGLELNVHIEVQEMSETQSSELVAELEYDV